MRYAFIKRQIRTVHWMSGAVCLIGMLLFAATGITLNHAGSLTAKPVTFSHEASSTLTARLSPKQRKAVESDPAFMRAVIM